MAKKGQVSIIQIVIAIILIVAVAIPVTDDVVTDVNASGTTGTILDLLTLMLAVGALVVISVIARGR